jgi:hypothetical protein
MFNATRPSFPQSQNRGKLMDDDSELEQPGSVRRHRNNESFSSTLTGNGSDRHNRGYSDDYDVDNGICSSPSSWIASGICDVSSLSKDKMEKIWTAFKTGKREESDGVAVQSVMRPPKGSKNWREEATRKLFRDDGDKLETTVENEEDDDDDDDYSSIGSKSNDANANAAVDPSSQSKLRVSVDTGMHALEPFSKVPHVNSSLSYAALQREQQRRQAGIVTAKLEAESRIVAPNVARLSPGSCVEIRLHSGDTCVAVLCSVDVLKMRSVFFHDILAEQDMTSRTDIRRNEIWRAPIVVPESSPYEAAAFVSVHPF